MTVGKGAAGKREEFVVSYTQTARDDLLRLFDYLLMRAQTSQDLEAAQGAIDAVRAAVEGQLSRTPFIFRKAGDSPFLRELVIPFATAPFATAGYVALYEIESDKRVNVLAVRHQREDDYH